MGNASGNVFSILYSGDTMENVRGKKLELAYQDVAEAVFRKLFKIEGTRGVDSVENAFPFCFSRHVVLYRTH